MSAIGQQVGQKSLAENGEKNMTSYEPSPLNPPSVNISSLQLSHRERQTIFHSVDVPTPIQFKDSNASTHSICLILFLHLD